MNGSFLENLTILHLDNQSNIEEKIISSKADISKNNWLLYDVKVFKSQNGIFNEETLKIKKFTLSII